METICGVPHREVTLKETPLQLLPFYTIALLYTCSNQGSMYVFHKFILLLVVLLDPMMMMTLCCTATQRKTKKDFTIAQQVHEIGAHTHCGPDVHICNLAELKSKFILCRRILAGIWLCGIIILLDEWFRDEAKSQV